jgi:hypothetical protein
MLGFSEHGGKFLWLKPQIKLKANYIQHLELNLKVSTIKIPGAPIQVKWYPSSAYYNSAAEIQPIEK